VTALGDPPTWLSNLRAAYARSLDAGAGMWTAAHAAVAAGQVPAAALAEAALLALEQMADGDPTSLGMSACEALRQCGGASQLDRLKAARPRLPARSGLRDWRVDADQAIRVIEARVEGACTCAAEAASRAGCYGAQWQIEDERSDPAQYCVHMTVSCRSCGARWSVRREDSYHYPIFAWTLA
jgi:hypothetical protein